MSIGEEVPNLSFLGLLPSSCLNRIYTERKELFLNDLDKASDNGFLKEVIKKCKEVCKRNAARTFRVLLKTNGTLGLSLHAKLLYCMFNENYVVIDIENKPSIVCKKFYQKYIDFNSAQTKIKEEDIDSKDRSDENLFKIIDMLGPHALHNIKVPLNIKYVTLLKTERYVIFKGEYEDGETRKSEEEVVSMKIKPHVKKFEPKFSNPFAEETISDYCSKNNILL